MHDVAVAAILITLIMRPIWSRGPSTTHLVKARKRVMPDNPQVQIPQTLVADPDDRSVIRQQHRRGPKQQFTREIIGLHNIPFFLIHRKSVSRSLSYNGFQS